MKSINEIMSPERQEELLEAARYSKSHGNEQLTINANEFLGLFEIAEEASKPAEETSKTAA